MKLDLFDINNFNVIEDDENYYVFRAIEPDDLDDIEKGLTIPTKIRTYRERYNERNINDESRYTNSTEISLVEIWDHIRKNFYPATNCISFSTNCNVSIDYGSYGNNTYLMMKVPKNDFNNVYFASKYMIEELNKIITEVEEKIEDYNVKESINSINNAKDIPEIVRILRSYSEINKPFYRFINRQFFNEEQNLEYNKLLGRLTLLELTGNIDSILPRTNDNQSLVATIGMACSSGEVIHYNSDIKNDIMAISPIFIDLFSLLQQALEKDVANEKIKEMESKVLELVLKNYTLTDNRLGNSEESIIVNDLFDTVINSDKYKLNSSISIDDMYKLTNGSIPYEKAKRALEFTYGMAKSRQKTIELSEVLRKIMNNYIYDDIINYIARECYLVSSEILSRKNNEGIKVCESVNIDINNDTYKYKKEEVNRIIDLVKHMSSDEIYKLLKSNGLSLETKLCDDILETESQKSLNRYFAETLIDRLDFNRIFNSLYYERVMSTEEKELLINRFEEIDCRTIYNALLENNIDEKEIPSIIINLLLNRGLGSININDLSKSENLIEIIRSNKAMLDSKISASRLDKLLGINDEVYVDGLNVTLRDYQDQTVKRLNKIYENKSYAGVVLPTGAGKSFVALTIMLQHKDENIIYYAPNENILFQMQEHILKNILGVRVLSEEEEKYYKINGIPIPEGTVFSKDVMNRIKDVFPYLEMNCYQGVIYKDEDFFESRNAGLIILDEAHRIAADEKLDKGAQKFQQGISNLIESNPNAKILALTATPIRDVDRVDSLAKFAKISGEYTPKEIKQKQYLAAEMTAIDAMQNGYIVTPNVVTFDYMLDESSQYKEMKYLYETATDPVLKKELKKRYDAARELISKAKEKDITQIIESTLIENKKPKNGKYIIFLPRNNTNISTEKYFESKINEVSEYFKNIDPELETHYLYSSRVDKKENELALRRFNGESEHLQLIFAIDMLNEGTHFENVDGILMLRPLKEGNKILYNQQTGRCIFSIDPEHELELSKVPIIFDLYNNYLEQNMNRAMHRHSISSDLEIMRRIDYWINNHKRFPDINNGKSNIESMNAISLKRIQLKYERFIDDPSLLDGLNEQELYQIKEIILLGNKYNLWLVSIPKLENKEVEKQVNIYSLKGTQKEFIETYNEMKKISSYDTKATKASLRITKALNVLEVLEEYGVKINTSRIKMQYSINDIIKYLPKNVRSVIGDNIEEDLLYPIGREYYFVRSMYSSKNPIFNNYEVPDLYRLGIYDDDNCVNEKGFIISGPKKFINQNIYTGNYYDEDGYNINGLDEKNFDSSSSFLNIYNFDREGYYYEVTDSGEVIPTGSKLNPYGFDVNGDYCEIREDGTIEKIGKLNRYNFNIDGYYCSYDKNNQIKITKNKYDPFGFDINGNYLSRIVVEDGLHYIEMEDGLISINKPEYRTNNYSRIDTGLPYDSHYFDREGYYYELRKDGKRYKTNRKYNERFLDRYSNYYELGDDGERHPTLRKYDDNFFDLDGYYYTDENNERVKTENKCNLQQFNKDGLKIIDNQVKKVAFDREGFVYYYDINIGKFIKAEPETKIDKYGFDVNQKHHKKNEDGTFSEETDGLVDEYGFSFYGTYKTNKKRGTYYDSHGFDVNGLTVDGKIYNKYFFDRDGYYYGYKVSFEELLKIIDSDIKDPYYYKTHYSHKNPRSIDEIMTKAGYERKKTKHKYNERFLDIDGRYYKAVIKEGKRVREIDKTRFLDMRGFDLDGKYCVKTKDGRIVPHPFHPLYDSYGFDVDGFYYSGKVKIGRDMTNTARTVTNLLYNDYHFDKFGRFVEVDSDGRIIKITNERWNKRGFDRDGLYHELLEDGTRNPKPSEKYYDENFVDIDGMYCILNEDGNIIDRRRYNEKGFDYNGLSKETSEKYNKLGFDMNGIHKDTGTYYDKYGFDWDGYYHRLDDSGNRVEDHNNQKFDEYGFDIHHNNKDTNTFLDENGFDIEGHFFKDANNDMEGKEFNERGFDRDGNFYEYDYSKEEYIKTNKKYDEKGFDFFGYYWKVTENGDRIKTEEKFNEDGFDAYGFDKKGINKYTNTKWDKNGFDINGFNQYTKEKYDIMGINRDSIRIRMSSPYELIIKEKTIDDRLYCVDLIERYLRVDVESSVFYDEIRRTYKKGYKADEMKELFYQIFFCAYVLDENIRNKVNDKLERITKKIEDSVEEYESIEKRDPSYYGLKEMKRVLNKLKSEQSLMKKLKKLGN